MEKDVYIPAKPNGIYAQTIDQLWISPFLPKKLQFLLNLRFKLREEKNYEKADRIKEILLRYYVKEFKDIKNGVQVELRHSQFKYHTLWFEINLSNGSYDFKHTRIMNYSYGFYWNAKNPYYMLEKHIDSIMLVVWYRERNKRFNNNENWQEMFNNPQIHSQLVDKYKNKEMSWFRIRIDKSKKV